MRPISRKLRSASGASMLLALLFLFFCLTVGAVVLTAASVSAGRTARDRASQQAYLAVESAAGLLREDLSALTFTGSYTETWVETVTLVDPDGERPSYETATETTYARGAASLSGSALLAGKAADFFAVYCAAVPDLNTRVPQAPAYQLVFTADGLPDVTADLTVAPSADPSQGRAAYTVTAVLRAAGDSPHTLTMVFPPQVSAQRAAPGDASVVETDTQTVTTRETTYSQTVTWDSPAITKGASA